MNKMDPIDDYIEPQLIIKAKAHEIEELTRKGDFAAAYEANKALQAASQKLGNWLCKHMKEDKKEYNSSSFNMNEAIEFSHFGVKGRP